MSDATPHTPDEIDNLVAALKIDDMKEELTGMFRGELVLKDIKGLTDRNMEAVYNLAYNAYGRSNFDQAEDLFKFLCVYDHMEKKYWIGLGATRQNKRQYEGAIEAFAYAALLDNEDPRPPMQAADCHIALGNKDEAISALQAAIEFAGANPEYAAIKSRATAVLELVEKGEHETD